MHPLGLSVTEVLISIDYIPRVHHIILQGKLCLGLLGVLKLELNEVWAKLILA